MAYQISNTFNDALSRLQNAQRDTMQPLEKALCTSVDNAIGLKFDGRTVRWMRNVQHAITYLFACAGAIVGSFPAVLAASITEVLRNSPIVILQRVAVYTAAQNFFSKNEASRALFYNTFRLPSSPEANAAANHAFSLVIAACTYASGYIGAGVGGITSSVIVPPVSGAVNVVEYLTGYRAN